MKTTKKEYESHKRAMRSLELSEETEDSLIKRGFTSPLNIVKRTEISFINEAKKTIGMEPEEAKNLYQKANKISQKALQLYMNLKTTLGSDYYMALKSNSITDEFKNEFEEIINYQQLFGSLDHREGEDWESIFGPAAYFVDLMRIVDRYITGECKDIPKGYTLGERRPDLEQIVLNKQNTEKPVPYLKIVNERLCSAVKTWLNTEEPERALTELTYPLGLPVNLPLEDLRLLLAQKNTSLSQIYRAFGADEETVALETVSLTKDELYSLSKPVSGEELASLYGLKPKELASLKNKDFFLETVQMEPEKLQELLNQGLKPEEEALASGFFINRGLPEGEYVREKDGTLLSLTADTLDRINRFLRLSRMLSLSFERTDWLIKCLSESGEIDESFCGRAAAVLSAIRELKPDFYDFICLIGPIKTYGENCLFDRIFNQDILSYHPKHGKNPEYGDPVILWDKENEARIVNWLSASLGIKAEEVKKLAEVLYQGSAPELTVENLSLLYRHTLLAGYLKMDIPQYIVFLSLQKESKMPEEKKVMGYRQDKEKLDHCGLSAYEADFICRGTVSPYVSLKFTDASLTDFLIYTSHLTGEKKEEELLRLTASFLSAGEETIRALISLTDRQEGSAGFSKLFEQPLNNRREIETLLLTMNRLLLLIEKGAAADVLLHIQENGGRFGISDPCRMTLHELLAIFDFMSFISEFRDNSHKILGCTGTEDKDLIRLCSVTLWDESTVKEISAGYLKNESNIIRRLTVLKNITGLLNTLNVNLSFLEQLLSVKDRAVRDYDALEEIRKKTAAALLANLPGQVIDARELRIRDCYLSIVCHKTRLKKTEVYKYLLIDPEMSEKNQITVLREAMNAVQLYLKRCQMGLEKGVKDLEIDENWWSWIMDYNLWRANREIFIYPENYIVPSLRHTKTSLFKNVESGLLQSAVDKNYLETLYEQYFEDFSGLAEIDICAALKAGKELYLFGRTRNQPYTTFYCIGKNGQAFGEWKKIETNISGRFLTPVYAGGRIFLFWAQLHKDSKVTLEGSTSTEHNTYRVTIQYIYMNTRKQWSTPQEFIKDEIVFHETAGKNYLEGCSLFDGLFDMTDPVWEKVVVLPVSGKNFSPFMEREETFERLCVFYGPLLNTATEAIDTQMLEITPPDRDGQEFMRRMRETARHYKDMLFQGQKGLLTAGFSRVFNLNFQTSCLIRENEYIMLDEYAPMLHTAVYSPKASPSAHSLGVLASPCPIGDMYWKTPLRLKTKTVVTISETSFMSSECGIDENKSRNIYKHLRQLLIINTESRERMAWVDQTQLNRNDLKEELIQKTEILGDVLQINHVQTVLYDSMESRLLFEAGIDSSARLLPVSNQPGDFIVDTGEETFLFQAKKQDNTSPYKSLSEGVTVSFPLVSITTLRKDRRLNSSAGNIMDKLKAAGLIDERKILRLDTCTLEEIGEMIEDEEDAAAVYSILQNDPLVDPSVFADEQAGINQELSVKLYDRLTEEGYITDRRVSLYRVFDSYCLPDMVEELLNAEERTGSRVGQITDFILQKLSMAPIPVSIKYWTDEELSESGLSYRIIRLSTGAVKRLKSRLEENGIKSLLSIETQNIPVSPILPFDRFYAEESPLFKAPAAGDGTGVDFNGLYGEYYWEMFYHIPMLIAQNLKDSSRNEDCRRWQEYVFSPTNQKQAVNKNTFYLKAPEHFNMQRSEQIYKLLLSEYVIDPLGTVAPKYDRKLSFLKNLLPEKEVRVVKNILDNGILIPENAYFWNFFPFRQHNPEEIYEMLSDKSEAMTVYREDPFNPHGVARLRIGAYEKYSLIQYVENIIAWGDREFIRNSWESLTLASMYYITAFELLGPRPVKLGSRPKRKPVTFQKIKESYEEIPSFLIEFAGKMDNSDGNESPAGSVPFTDISLYFGIPENDMLMKLWDLVDDRLYKLRNCLDIDGNARFLETYGKRIDPMMLSKAISSAQSSPAVLNPSTAAPYPYRFSFLMEQAKGLANRLAAVGAQMLSTSEKRDSEELALTAGNNEKQLSDMMTTVKELQIEEMKKGLKGLENSFEGSSSRYKYYSGLMEKGLSEGETESLAASDTAFAMTTAANVMKMAAAAAHGIPQLGSPFAMTYGGVQIGAILDGTAGVMELGGGIASFISGRSATMAGYERRRQEWTFQKENAAFEMDGIKCQMDGYQDKIAQAERDLEIHKLSLEQKDRMISYLKTKFTGRELYQWMQGRLNTVVFQTYNQAMELALQAQEAYRNERDSKESFIVFEYWDNSKKGLLAGENLLTSLEQMQLSYLKKNERKLEIEKHVSLSQCCPKAFLDLKSTGKCSFDFTEAMFDYDYPGCYSRKIVNISLSIPALLGPYQNIKAILKQTGMHKTVTSPDKKGVIFLLENKGDKVPESVRLQASANQCIAISRGIDDSGMFSLSFGDERYLPFEGTGAVSTWELSMPKNTNRFDFESISDVIVHVRYQALFSESLKTEVERELAKYPVAGSLYYSLAHAKRAQWNQFAEETDENGVHTLAFELSPRYEYLKEKKIKAVYVKLLAKGDKILGDETVLCLGLPAQEEQQVCLKNNLGEVIPDVPMERLAGNWHISYKGSAVLENMELLLIYEGRFDEESQ